MPTINRGSGQRQAKALIGGILGSNIRASVRFCDVTAADRAIALAVLPLIPKSVTPNQVTIFRFASIPVIIALLLAESYLFATILFAVAAFSDAVDGAMARTRGEVSAWGIMFDPIADKALVAGVAAILVSATLGVLLAASIIAIEIALVVSIRIRYGGALVPAKTVGKIKMILQSFGLGFLFLYVTTGAPFLLAISEYTLYAAILFALLSLLVYRTI